jgi:hypothetical protein
MCRLFCDRTNIRAWAWITPMLLGPIHDRFVKWAVLWRAPIFWGCSEFRIVNRAVLWFSSKIDVGQFCARTPCHLKYPWQYLEIKKIYRACWKLWSRDLAQAKIGLTLTPSTISRYKNRSNKKNKNPLGVAPEETWGHADILMWQLPSWGSQLTVWPH